MIYVHFVQKRSISGPLQNPVRAKLASNKKNTHTNNRNSKCWYACVPPFLRSWNQNYLLMHVGYLLVHFWHPFDLNGHQNATQTQHIALNANKNIKRKPSKVETAVAMKY